ncbi:MAG: SDR family NAD(P)-dependent oxidoreductase [Gemmatimonadota bacterium]
MKRVVLVGATDGIGRALAREYLERGWWVGVVGRDALKLERVVGELRTGVDGGVVEGAVCDVADAEAAAPAFESIVKALGQLDLLVYCAGVMPPEHDLRSRLDAVSSILDVNVEGAVRWLELGADHMGSVGGGRLAAIGSMAGERGRKGAPAYCASKAALHEYLEGLRHRLHGSGIGVSTAKPGWVRTRMLPAESSGSPLAVDPGRAARIIADRLARGSESFFVPRWWGLVALALRLTPRFLYKRIAPA